MIQIFLNGYRGDDAIELYLRFTSHRMVCFGDVDTDSTLVNMGV